MITNLQFHYFRAPLYPNLHRSIKCLLYPWHPDVNQDDNVAAKSFRAKTCTRTLNNTVRGGMVGNIPLPAHPAYLRYMNCICVCSVNMHLHAAIKLITIWPRVFKIKSMKLDHVLNPWSASLRKNPTRNEFVIGWQGLEVIKMCSCQSVNWSRQLEFKKRIEGSIGHAQTSLTSECPLLPMYTFTN